MKIFDLLVYAIVFIVLIILFYQIINIFFPQKTDIAKLKQGITLAQMSDNMGKTVLINGIQYQKGTTIDKTALEEKHYLLSFECNDPNICCIQQSLAKTNEPCNKDVIWDTSYLTFNQTKPIMTNARCTLIQDYPTCKIYFGTMPAQATIKKIEVLDQNQGTGEIKVLVTNTGKNTLTLGKNTLKLYSQLNEKWVETDYQSDAKTIETILPKEEYVFYWGITPKNSGKYKAEFTFEGTNSGFDIKSIIFNINTSLKCKIDSTQQAQTIFDPTTHQYQEIHSCIECNYAFECASAWSNATGKTFTPYKQNQAYCIKTTQNGAC